MDTLAALEGRITTTPLKPGAAEINAFLESRKVLPEAQAPRRPYADDNHKPDFPRSYALHVLPSQIEGTGNYGGMDFWSLQGFDVKGVISILITSIAFASSSRPRFDGGERYDFSMILPEPEGWELMNGRFQQGLQDHFHLTAAREVRLMDVYVVTIEGRKPPAVKAPAEEGRKVSVSSLNLRPLKLRVIQARTRPPRCQRKQSEG